MILNRRIIIALLFITVLIGLFTSLTFSADNVAPDFELKDLEGKRVSFKDFKGKVVLLNFWATWCAPCRAEMPSLENLYRSFKGKGLTAPKNHRFFGDPIVVIGVSVDNSDNSVRSFVRQKKITFPILLDSKKEVSFDDYGVIGLPVTFLIDQKGIIVEKVFGERQWDSEEIKEKIKRLLEGR